MSQLLKADECAQRIVAATAAASAPGLYVLYAAALISRYRSLIHRLLQFFFFHLFIYLSFFLFIYFFFIFF